MKRLSCTKLKMTDMFNNLIRHFVSSYQNIFAYKNWGLHLETWWEPRGSLRLEENMWMSPVFWQRSHMNFSLCDSQLEKSVQARFHKCVHSFYFTTHFLSPCTHTHMYFWNVPAQTTLNMSKVRFRLFDK